MDFKLFFDWKYKIVWKYQHQFHKRYKAGMHSIHHLMSSAMHCALCTESMGTYAIIVSWHHKLDKIENNKHRIITRCFYATLLTVSCSSSQSHLISNKSSQQMIPCLLVTKETLILLTWTQYNEHHLIYLADLYFYISLSEHFISDNLRHEIF